MALSDPSFATPINCVNQNRSGFLAVDEKYSASSSRMYLNPGGSGTINNLSIKLSVPESLFFPSGTKLQSD